MTQDTTLGIFTQFANLNAIEQEIVSGTWTAAKNAYVPRSNFPVGSVILAENDQGESKLFSGCNVENRFFTPTICAERNAITSAVAAGYRKILKAALVCQKYQGPGASPCGLCRQVLVEFGRDAEMFNMADSQNNVRRFMVCELLPAASATAVPFAQLPPHTKRLVKRLDALSRQSYVPYSKRPAAAIVTAANSRGSFRHFSGIADDNSSYGGSALAECVALRAARTAAFDRQVSIAVTVEAPSAFNPIEGECLQVLREFGVKTKVLLVGPDKSVVQSSVEELLPDSFGPESLA
jgi:cytidine deaminase